MMQSLHGEAAAPGQQLLSHKEDHICWRVRVHF